MAFCAANPEFESGDAPGADSCLARETLWQGPADAKGTALRRRGLAAVAAIHRAFLDRVKPGLVLIWNGSRAQELLFASLAKERGIPLEYLERAPFPGFLQWDPEGILGSSSLSRATQEDLPTQIGPGELNACRQLKELYSGKTAPTWWHQPDPATTDSLRQRFRLTPETRLILFLGQVPLDAQTLLYSPRFANSMEALIWLRESVDPKEVFILGKHHPKDPTPPQRYREALGSAGEWITDQPIHACLDACDGAAAINSSGLYETLFRGKPVLLLGRAILSHKEIAYEIPEQPDPLADRETVRAWLEQEGRAERVANWERFLAWMLRQRIFLYELPESPSIPKGAGGFSEFADLAYTSSTEPLHGCSDSATDPSILDLWDRLRRNRRLQPLLEWESRLKDLGRAGPGSAPGLLIWGTGQLGRAAIEFCRHISAPVEAFVDNDPLRVGTDLKGLPIYSGSEIAALPPAGRFCLIASEAHPAIAAQLESVGWKRGIHFEPFTLSSWELSQAIDERKSIPVASSKLKISG